MRILVSATFLFCTVLLDATRLLGADLARLNEGRNVHLVMLGHGLLCDAKVQERWPDRVTLKLLKTTAECGAKGELIHLSKQKAQEIVEEERLTKRRIIAKVFAGLGAVALLAVVPLTSSHGDNWLLLGNFAIPGFAAYKASELVPSRLDYLILMTCNDSLHCFEDATGDDTSR